MVRGLWLVPGLHYIDRVLGRLGAWWRVGEGVDGELTVDLVDDLGYMKRATIGERSWLRKKSFGQ